MRDFFEPDHAAPKVLRPHQVKAIAGIRHSLAGGNKRVVLQAATGFGKTLTAAKIIEGSLAKGNRVIFTVPALTLIEQTVAAFEAEGIERIGVIQANHPRTDERAPVQVASVHTLARRDPPRSPVVLVDECHVRSKAIENLMKAWPDAVFIGFSATPWAKGMGRLWQDLTIAATTRELIDGGYLCPFRCWSVSTPDLSGVRTVAGEYHLGDLDEAMQGETKIVGDAVENWLARGEARPTLAYGVSRDHAWQLHEGFLAAGIASAYVDAFTDKVERAVIERAFRAGEVKVACSVRTLTTGIDWPVACIVDCAPTKSEMLHVQRWGRGLRVNPPWPDLLVFDHASNVTRLGFPTDIDVSHDGLDDGKAPAPGKAGEADERLPRACGDCGFMCEPSAVCCPSCGHEFPRRKRKPVQHREGDLEEITHGAGKPKPTREEKQRWYSGLLWIEESRRYKRGWAVAKYKSRFSVWPRGISEEMAPPNQEIINWVKSEQIRWAKSNKKRGAGNGRI